MVEIMEDTPLRRVELSRGVPAVSDVEDPILVGMISVVRGEGVGQCKRCKDDDLWADTSVIERQVAEV